MGWLIDPESRSVLVYLLSKQPELRQLESDILSVPNMFGNFKLTVGELFDWLKI